MRRDGPASLSKARRERLEHSCWVCGSLNSTHWKSRSLTRKLTPADLTITDHRYGETLSLRKCVECGFVFASDPDVADLDSLYTQMSDAGYIATLDSRSLQMRWLLKLVRKLHPKGSTLLDIGAGAGLLVAEAGKHGFSAIGVEPSTDLVSYALANKKVEVLEGAFPHPAISRRQFDVVTLIDVIEHVNDPLGLLRAAGSTLTEGGILLVVTPDVNSITARLLGHRWWHYRLAHVGYFASRSLEKLAELAQLELVYTTRPRWFFRIGYLMERLATYLPLAWLNRRSARSTILKRVYNFVVTINLRDSLLVVYRRADGFPRNP